MTGIASLLAPVAHAEKADRDKPIFYQGDTGGANLNSNDGELSGNVVITQGTMTIRADRVVFHQNPDNSLSATAYGNPVTFREKRDGVDEYYEGFAQRAVYDGEKRFLELFDRALLKKNNDEIRSNYISYNAATEVFKAEGRPDTRPAEAGEAPLGPRVRGVFQPQPKEDKGTQSKDDKGTPAKDDKNAQPKQDKSAKASAEPKPSNPLPLKADSSVSVQSGK
ncbi:MAG TPA: lipopolysaccharide transport periplasmic protein LptA [Casimicrobiaceae bacterium]|nr:lipopolysaccharide transport periplasmic protein LptA [Casimicrobiaceae bacterium]